MPDRQSRVLRLATRSLFWLFAIVSLLIVLLSAYAAVPVLVALAQGGHARLWCFGRAGLVVLTAAIYLAVAIAVLARRRGAGRRP